MSNQQTYRVWDPDDTDEAGASTIKEHSVEYAAEHYVKARCDYLSDNIDNVDLLVRTDDGNVYEVSVAIEFEVSYYGHLGKLREPRPAAAPCPKCHGEGKVMERDSGPTGDGNTWDKVRCRKCDGAGEVDVPSIYEKLLLTWQRDTVLRSDMATDHPSYAQLVAAGPNAVPTLLRALEKDPSWKALSALRGIYRSKAPHVKDIAGQLVPICKRWIEWAKTEGLAW